MHRATRLVAAAAVTLAAVQLAGCATTTGAGAVGADRQQLMLVSSADLEKQAAQSYTQLRNDAAAKGVLNRDPTLTKRVQAIAARLEPQTGVFRPDAPGWKWEVNVVTSHELNAFCMPGGKIIFFSGLITRMALTDDEIAVIAGHEIAHALREHSREQLSQSMAADTAISVGAALLGLGSLTTGLTSTAYNSLVATSFSRGHETEADRIGLELTARAGYDPRAGVTVWKKMAAAHQGGASAEFLSTHPTDATRVREIESLLPAVMPLYEAARRK